MRDLRERVKILLVEHEMDQRELAFRSGLSSATISGFLGGSVRPIRKARDVKLSTIRKIAKVLGCQVEIHLVNTGFSC